MGNLLKTWIKAMKNDLLDLEITNSLWETMYMESHNSYQSIPTTKGMNYNDDPFIGKCTLHVINLCSEPTLFST